MGCEPTYEGLKVILTLNDRASINCCEPTYEGLKVISAILSDV